MLHDIEFAWQIAQRDRDRLIASWQATVQVASAAQSPRRGRRSRLLLRRGSGAELWQYIKSEWSRPMARTERIPTVEGAG